MGFTELHQPQPGDDVALAAKRLGEIENFVVVLKTENASLRGKVENLEQKISKLHDAVIDGGIKV